MRAQDLHEARMRVARVQEERLAELESELELRHEPFLLVGMRRIVAVEVEAAFTDRDAARMNAKVAELRDRALVAVACVMRMDARGAVEVVAIGDLRRQPALEHGGPGDDQRRDAGGASARQDRVDIVVKARMREVGADVDELHAPSIARPSHGRPRESGDPVKTFLIRKRGPRLRGDDGTDVLRGEEPQLLGSVDAGDGETFGEGGARADQRRDVAFEEAQSAAGDRNEVDARCPVDRQQPRNARRGLAHAHGEREVRQQLARRPHDVFAREGVDLPGREPDGERPADAAADHADSDLGAAHVFLQQEFRRPKALGDRPLAQAPHAERIRAAARFDDERKVETPGRIAEHRLRAVDAFAGDQAGGLQLVVAGLHHLAARAEIRHAGATELGRDAQHLGIGETQEQALPQRQAVQSHERGAQLARDAVCLGAVDPGERMRAPALAHDDQRLYCRSPRRVASFSYSAYCACTNASVAAGVRTAGTPPSFSLPASHCASCESCAMTALQRSTTSAGRPYGPASADQATRFSISGQPRLRAVSTPGRSFGGSGIVVISARSVPDFSGPMSAPRLLQANCTCPASSAVASSPEPLYGMPSAASRGRPRSENRYCGPKFCSVPAPTVAKLSFPGRARMSSIRSFIVAYCESPRTAQT